ncbi:MAG: UDP-N-acetylmuramoyl-L-alanyl-D-glutamate--2,6-diaminopimelate ligase [Candidatus Moranbacteria bacterium]|nr:UDP-N-acetylmuramoyl-L-alanyl-D-glutamate--2,6-diaminopimelate ligase [Candidatus Moranbacteria bacterium]
MKKMKRLISKVSPQSIKNIAHRVEAWLSAAWFGIPARGLTIIGVTGTNGKTTTANILARMLEADGKRVALASTISFRIAGREKVNASKFTTLGGYHLQKFLHDAKNAGCSHVVLEVSSHALDQGRVAGLRFEVAVITNVTREHLDYHKTMEEYRRAKGKLFDLAKAVVVNLDMWEPEFFLAKAKRKKTFSTVESSADLLAENLVLTMDGARFSVGETRFSLSLPGKFNVENTLAALGAAVVLGVPVETAAKATSEISLVAGRMESVPNDIGATILIDYALTPDSLGKLYELVSSMKKEGTKIVSVFGACGDRDRGKRPMMGEIVSSVADVIILTDEDPYYEDPDRILDEVESGIRNMDAGTTLFRIRDRREAIRKGLSLLSSGDTLLITGKGAEEVMQVRDIKIPWNDKKVITEELETMNASR